MEPFRRMRLQATALLLVMLIVGALAGAAGYRALANPVLAGSPADDLSADRRDDDRDRDRRRPILLEPEVLDQLHVTAEQRARIERILDRREEQNKALWDQFKPQFDTLMHQSRREMWAQLSAEQQAKLELVIKERRARWREQHNHDSTGVRSRTGPEKKQTER